MNNFAQVAEYTEVFDRNQLNAIRMFLRKFGNISNEELLDIVSKLRLGFIESERIRSEEMAKRSYRNDEAIPLDDRTGKEEKLIKRNPDRKVRKLNIVIGTCPQCDSKLLGEPVPQCETRKTGRTFYAECDQCRYYYEIFHKKIRNKEKYTKIEGGIENGRTENDR